MADISLQFEEFEGSGAMCQLLQIITSTEILS